MWIAFRLILAVIGFVIRQLSRGKKTATDGTFQGIGYFEKVRTTKQVIKGFSIGMERRSPTWLRCHAESAVDRAFKRLRIANEVQTGDERFDDLVYVTCDHPYIQALLAESPELRDATAAVIDAGYKRVVFNGSTVAIERDSDSGPRPSDFALLKQLHTASARLEDEMPSRFGDPFLWKALIAEGVFWSVVGYAIGAFASMAFHNEDFHLSRTAVVNTGLMVAAVAYLVLTGLIILMMRGSSRGHRVIVEGAVLLLLALPVSAIQITGDTNRALDDGPPTLVSRTYNQCEVREHRGRRGKPRKYSYHLWLEPVAEGETPGPVLPHEVDVSRELCNAATPGGTVVFSIGPGRWGLPWYRRIEIDDTAWTAPL